MEERLCWIGLNRLLSPQKCFLLLEHFPSARAIWHAGAEELRAVPGFETQAETFVRRRAAIDLEPELREIQRQGLRVLTLADEDYPAALRGLEGAPPVLYLKGELVERDALALAVVGTRRASGYGRRATERLVRALAARGFTIVSGLALGIDTAAHKAALAAGGRTLAVLGSGFGALYPSENRHLAERIAAQGAVLSEFPVFTEPARWTFPRRNRIISGLSRGVLVVEAPRKSGALITARLALEQGREVFAVPGSIFSPQTAGCHALLRDGAVLVTDAADVLETFPELRPALEATPPRSQPAATSLAPSERRVLEVLGYEPLHLNAVVERSGLSVAEVSAILIGLEMQGLVSETDGKHYVRVP